MDSTCRRCGGTAKEELTFSSRYKTTKVHLCDDCFLVCRKAFEALILRRDSDVKVLTGCDPDAGVMHSVDGSV